MTTTKPARIPSRNGLTAYVFADAQTLGTVLGGLAYVVGGVDLLLLVVTMLRSGNPLHMLILAVLAVVILLYAKYSIRLTK